MQMKKAVGRGSATRKYDILTALGVYALSQDRSLQRQTLRLICLITARYNWQHDELSVAQTEIARLWSVDTRTVKREMAVFRERGWLVERRAAARGRVTLFGLGIEQILEDTRPVWGNAGQDLGQRLAPEEPSLPEARVIPFPGAALPGDDTLWGRVARDLVAEDAAVFRAWFAGLEVEAGADALVLRAGGAFQANYIETHLLKRVERALARHAPGLRVVVR